MPYSYTDNCVRDHLHKFFDIVNKLSEMEISIDDDLLIIMMLYIIPSSYENFQCYSYQPLKKKNKEHRGRP